jgi:hypothetical protein
MKYKLSWKKFKKECPIVSRVPILNLIAYGIVAQAYNNQKIQNELFTNLLESHE